MNGIIELFDGIYNYNYSEGCCDDSEIFVLFKAGINNLSSDDDREELAKYFKKRYITTWLDHAKEDEDLVDLDDEVIKAENAFSEYWGNEKS